MGFQQCCINFKGSQVLKTRLPYRELFLGVKDIIFAVITSPQPLSFRRGNWKTEAKVPLSPEGGNQGDRSEDIGEDVSGDVKNDLRLDKSSILR